MVRISSGVRRALEAHALDCAPLEACGLLVGPADGAVVEGFTPVTNVAESETAFLLEPREMIDAELRADALGLEVKGVMHSHPTTDAWPSETDVADAGRFDPMGSWWSVIVSLASEPPVIRCFRIADPSIEEEPIGWM